jgi:hypothetical protein
LNFVSAFVYEPWESNHCNLMSVWKWYMHIFYTCIVAFFLYLTKFSVVVFFVSTGRGTFSSHSEYRLIASILKGFVCLWEIIRLLSTVHVIHKHYTHTQTHRHINEQHRLTLCCQFLKKLLVFLTAVWTCSCWHFPIPVWPWWYGRLAWHQWAGHGLS